MNHDLKETFADLNTKTFGKRIIFFKTINSTMDYAREISEEGEPEGTVVIADYQFQGRGRLGRTWKSEPAKNILMSIVLRPKIPIEKFFILPFLFSNSIADVIEEKTKLKVATKWPNDLLINDKKFCGILIEASITANYGNSVILGIGINVNQSQFPEELKPYATSLYLLTGKIYDRIELIKDILRKIEIDYEKLNETDNFELIMNRWRSRCTMIGKEVEVIQLEKIITGEVIDIDNEGFLVLKVQDQGIIRLSSGDVTIAR